MKPFAIPKRVMKQSLVADTTGSVDMIGALVIISFEECIGDNSNFYRLKQIHRLYQKYFKRIVNLHSQERGGR